MYTLKQSLAPELETHHPDDVLLTKSRLWQLGYYQVPMAGMDDEPDSPMFSGIKPSRRNGTFKSMEPSNPTARPTENSGNLLMSLSKLRSADV